MFILLLKRIDCIKWSAIMFIVNLEGAIYSGGKWLMIKRSEKEEQVSKLPLLKIF
ncbi:hypothetical protein GCM10008935_05420 [Alkalibacillus silvisoli]|uniref:Uncharacterized protein n=1 Tax=Alkalibacillus silvisoli TaxID=392823 RepID=A0ABN0ZN99_9BACI